MALRLPAREVRLNGGLADAERAQHEQATDRHGIPSESTRPRVYCAEAATVDGTVEVVTIWPPGDVTPVHRQPPHRGSFVVDTPVPDITIGGLTSRKIRGVLGNHRRALGALQNIRVAARTNPGNANVVSLSIDGRDPEDI